MVKGEATAPTRRLAVTIMPKKGEAEAWSYPANFWAEVRDEQDVAEVLLTALAYEAGAQGN